MPAPILIVHDDSQLRDTIATTLSARGHEVASFENPAHALDAIEAESRVRVLVSGVRFPPGVLNGDALARMLRFKRVGVAVVFVAPAADHRHTDELGDFLALPLDTEALARIVGRLIQRSEL